MIRSLTELSDFTARLLLSLQLEAWREQREKDGRPKKERRNSTERKQRRKINYFQRGDEFED